MPQVVALLLVVAAQAYGAVVVARVDPRVVARVVEVEHVELAREEPAQARHDRPLRGVYLLLPDAVHGLPYGLRLVPEHHPAKAALPPGSMAR